MHLLIKAGAIINLTGSGNATGGIIFYGGGLTANELIPLLLDALFVVKFLFINYRIYWVTEMQKQ